MIRLAKPYISDEAIEKVAEVLRSGNLVQGEYVEFDLVKTEDEKHEYKANDISGIKSGPLMCDTQAENNKARKTYTK